MRRYFIEYAGAVVFLIATCLLSAPIADRATGALRIAACLAPLLGLVAIGWTLIRFVLRTDELRRQMIVVAGAVSALAAGFFVMAFTLLEDGAGIRIPAVTLIPILAAVFVFSCVVLKRRYQ